MKKLLIILIAFVALFLGCSEDTLLNDQAKSADEDALQTEMTQSDTKANNGKAVTKTIKIRGAGIVSYECLEYDTDNNCIMYFAEAHGEGNASHLGLFTIDLTYYAGPDFNPIPNPISEIPPIIGTQTAANGDQLKTFALGPNPDGSLRFYYEGGTGRFENVTGYVDLFFTWPDQFTYSNYGEGTITY